MKKYIVITGDIVGFTRLPATNRESLINASIEMLSQWVEKPEHASIFRGDSFQLLFNNVESALKRCIQIRCWFKMNSLKGEKVLDAKMALGFGEISYMGKSVLDADGEAFHLSGRSFDELEVGESWSIVTSDSAKNEQLKMILNLADIIVKAWTINQAEVIFSLLEGKNQQQMAEELNIAQSAVNNRIKLAKWKGIEKTFRYITKLIEQ